MQLQSWDHGQNLEDLLRANGCGLWIIMQGQGCLFQIWNHCQCPAYLGDVWDRAVYSERDVDVFQCVAIHPKNIAQYRGDTSIVAQRAQIQSLQWSALVQ